MCFRRFAISLNKLAECMSSANYVGFKISDLYSLFEVMWAGTPFLEIIRHNLRLKSRKSDEYENYSGERLTARNTCFNEL